MPVLEVPETRTLFQKFNFLNVSSAHHSEDVRANSRSTSESTELVSTQPSATLDHKYSGKAVGDLHYLLPESMRPVGVLKTVVADQKLFINIAYPVHSIPTAHYAGSRFLFSLVKEDRDKSGAHCLVMTVLDPKSTIALDIDDDVQQVLDLARTCTGLTITTQYSLPKMKKKGTLDQVMLPISKVNGTSKETEKGHPKPPDKVLISEVRPTATATVSEPTRLGPAERYSTRLTSAILATPLPTRYTHHFSVPIQPGQLVVGSSASWSVYYDSQDSSLKILLPPTEEFLTIRVAKDDFRAFTKDGYLNVFYIAAGAG